MSNYSASHHLGRARDQRSFALTRPITIPAGESVHVDGERRSEFRGDTISILVATSKDTTAELVMPLEDALAIGLVVPTEDGR